MSQFDNGRKAGGSDRLPCTLTPKSSRARQSQAAATSTFIPTTGSMSSNVLAFLRVKFAADHVKKFDRAKKHVNGRTGAWFDVVTRASHAAHAPVPPPREHSDRWLHDVAFIGAVSGPLPADLTMRNDSSAADQRSVIAAGQRRSPHLNIGVSGLTEDLVDLKGSCRH